MSHMDVFEAAYRVAHDFRPDGAVGLARRLGKNPGTFLNKLNPHQETHHLTLGEAVAMSIAAADARIAQAFAWEVGGVFVRLPPPAGASDLELLTLMLQRDEAGGRFAQTVEQCLEDGRISARDWQAIRDAGVTYVSAFMALMQRFEGMSDAA